LSALNENQALREHVATSRGIFPHKRITRQSQMTSRGLVVVEHEETIAPPTVSSVSVASSEEPPSPKRSAIAELLYMRWLEGLRLKWPSLGS